MAATDLVTEALLQSLTTTMASAVKSQGAKAGDLPSLTTTAKASLVAAINELNAKPDPVGGVQINDASSTSTTTTWSAKKSSDAITAAVNALVDGAPTALDTLKELATAMGDSANFSATMTAALANRIRFDAAQSLTAPQQAQALANLGIARSTVDFAAAFTAAL